MPPEVPENAYDMLNMDSPFPPPPVCHLHPSSSMESIGGEGMQLSATPETNSSFEDALFIPKRTYVLGTILSDVEARKVPSKAGLERGTCSHSPFLHLSHPWAQNSTNH